VLREPEKRYLFGFLERLTHALGEAIGKNCEIVLHDFSEPEKSVVAIANGHITGRKIGDTLDVLGFQLLRQPPDGDLLNYQTTTKSGKVLRSSSIFLRTEQGEIFGSLCINCDLTGLLKLQEWLQGTIDAPQAGPQEEFEQSVDEVLDRLIRDAIYSTGKDISQLTRDEKIAVISYLESKGAFLVRYSMDRIAELLNLSKYTIYNYLEEIKARQAKRETVSTQHVAKQS
jgi:predicted transcriptional regulator YheO